MSRALEFKKAIENKDLTTVKIMIKGSFVIDPTFKELDEYIKYVEEKLPDLYEENDNEKFKNSNWDEDYMNEQLNNLMFNFSRERITHLREVCSDIYAERIEKIEKQREESGTSQKNKLVNKKKVATGSVVVGAGAVVGGVVLAETVLIVCGTALLVGGGIALIQEKNKK